MQTSEYMLTENEQRMKRKKGMLEYYKAILTKVKIWPHIYQKEYHKALRQLPAYENLLLQEWVQKNH